MGVKHADHVPWPRTSVSGEQQADPGQCSVQALGPTVHTIPTEEDMCPVIQAAFGTGSGMAQGLRALGAGRWGPHFSTPGALPLPSRKEVLAFYGFKIS